MATPRPNAFISIAIERGGPTKGATPRAAVDPVVPEEPPIPPLAPRELLLLDELNISKKLKCL
jgi:hypothetical protein